MIGNRSSDFDSNPLTSRRSATRSERFGKPHIQRMNNDGQKEFGMLTKYEGEPTPTDKEKEEFLSSSTMKIHRFPDGKCRIVNYKGHPINEKKAKFVIVEDKDGKDILRVNRYDLATKFPQHSYFIEGENKEKKAKYAGYLDVKDGKICGIGLHTGHFQMPAPEHAATEEETQKSFEFAQYVMTKFKDVIADQEEMNNADCGLKPQEDILRWVKTQEHRHMEDDVSTVALDADDIAQDDIPDIEAPTRLAVVGSGAAAMGVLRDLILKRGSKVDVFDPESHGTGFAYNKEKMSPYHLLNMKPKDMDAGFTGWFANNISKCHEIMNQAFKEELQNQEKTLKRKFTPDEKKLKKSEFENFKNRVMDPDTIKNIFENIENNDIDADLNSDFFVPRIIYGAYLKDELEKTVESLETDKGVHVKLKPHRVTDLEEKDDGSYILTRQLRKGWHRLRDIFRPTQKEYDKVVVATGHWQKPSRGSRSVSLWPAQDMNKKILDNAFKDAKQRYQESGETDININVAFLGTSLSTIDGLKTLFQDNMHYDQNGAVEITPKPLTVKADDGVELTVHIKADMISRNGYLPAVRSSRIQEFKNENLTEQKVRDIINKEGQVTLNKVWDMLSKDMEAIHEKYNAVDENPFKDLSNFSSKAAEEGFDGLAQSLFNAEQGTAYWQEVLAQAGSAFRLAYQHLPAQDKKIVGKMRSLFQARYAPIPKKNAEELLKLQEAGLLDLKSLKGADTDTHSETGIYSYSKDGEVTTYSSVIDGTGQSTNAMSDERELAQNLRKRGLVSAHFETRQLPEEDLATPLHQHFHSTADTEPYPTGQLRRTGDLRSVRDDGTPTKGLFLAGVTAMMFAVTRAAAVSSEGQAIAKVLAEYNQS